MNHWTLAPFLNAWLKWELDLFPVSKQKTVKSPNILVCVHFIFFCRFTLGYFTDAGTRMCWHHEDIVMAYYCRSVTDRANVIIYHVMPTEDRSVYFTVCQSKREKQIKEQSWHLSTLSFPSYTPVLSWSRSSNPPQGGTEINSTFIISIKSLSLNPRGKGRCRSFSSFTIPAVEV